MCNNGYRLRLLFSESLVRTVYEKASEKKEEWCKGEEEFREEQFLKKLKIPPPVCVSAHRAMQATRISPQPSRFNFDFIRHTFVPFRRVTKLHPDSTTCSHSIRCLHLFTNLHPSAWPSFVRICRPVNPTSRPERERERLDSIMNRIALSRSSFNWIPVRTM